MKSPDPLPIFPLVLDSTILNSFRACPQQCFLSYILNRRSKGENSHIIAGGAFAAGLERARRWYYELRTSTEDAVAAGLAALIKAYGWHEPMIKQKNKDLLHTARAYVSYFDLHPMDRDEIQPWFMGDKPAIEFTFALPFEGPGILHPNTGEPLLIAGRTDMIGVFGGMPFVIDEKTTGQMGESWSQQWDLRAQLTCYSWAARQSGFPVEGAIVRGICLRTNDTGHAEAIIYQPPWKINRWLWQTQRDILRMLEIYREYLRTGNSEVWDYVLGDACNQWGGCAFHELCGMQHPMNWIDSYTEYHVWSPLKK